MQRSGLTTASPSRCWRSLSTGRIGPPLTTPVALSTEDESGRIEASETLDKHVPEQGELRRCYYPTISHLISRYVQPNDCTARRDQAWIARVLGLDDSDLPIPTRESIGRAFSRRSVAAARDEWISLIVRVCRSKYLARMVDKHGFSADQLLALYRRARHGHGGRHDDLSERGSGRRLTIGHEDRREYRVGLRQARRRRPARAGIS